VEVLDPASTRVEERIILECISEIEGGVDWIHRDGDQWRSLVNSSEDSGSARCREFLGFSRGACVGDYCILKFFPKPGSKSPLGKPRF
jgi:hypothetical protein